MDTILHFAQAAAALILAIGARIGVVLLVIAAVVLPVLLVLQTVRAVRALRRRMSGVESAGGLHYRPGLSYAEGHTWARPENGLVYVGVDDLVGRILPWAVAVDLPRSGERLDKGAKVVRISTGLTDALIRAPISGTVVAVNESLSNEPSLVKRDGYGKGWLFAVKPANDDLEHLRRGDAARDWMAQEGHRLHGWVERRLGTAAADGGELIDPLAGHLTGKDWEELTGQFL
jgi:glycine cleavage system H protein